MSLREQLSDTLKLLESKLDSLPSPLRKDVQERIGELRQLLLDQRAPRFVLVGRRGSGKSSLINAVFGKPVAAVGHETSMTGEASWEVYEGDLGTLEVLDTRGLQEGSPPEQADAESTPEGSILKALVAQPPDAFLFLVKASEVDAAIGADLDALERITDRIAKACGARLPIIAVITQCDLVEPKNVGLHDPEGEVREDLEEKRERVERIQQHLEGLIRDRDSLKADLVRVVPVAAYMSWRRDGSVRADERWQVDALLTFLLDELPNESKVELARLSQVAALQKTIARRVVHASSVVAGGIAMTPIPVADMLPLSALQAQMVIMVGYLGGRQLDVKGALEFIGGLGVQFAAGYGLREVARAVLKFFPGAGNAGSAAIAAGGTKALGEAAIVYYIDGFGMKAARRRLLDAKEAEE